MENTNIFEELGIPKKYLKKTVRDDRSVALVHKQWLKSLLKHSKLVEFIEKTRLESWPLNESDIGPSFIKIFINVYRKKDVKVIPLPRIRPVAQEDNSLMFSQLMQYISQTNYKNLWKEAYKKYSTSLDAPKDTQITLTDYNEVLRDIIIRIYGCKFIDTNSQLNLDYSKDFDVHFNILPAICAVETLNAIFLLHPYIEHNLNDCVTFSPAILEKCHAKPLFIVYQLLQILKSLHDRSLTLGNISLSDIYVNEDLWIYVFPQISSNIYIKDLPVVESKKVVKDCRKSGHKFSNFKCEFCGLKTFDRVQLTHNESLEKLCQFWVDGQISNFTYISALNKLSGRKLGDPNCHHVFPWVTDFSSRCGRNWRDLKKSKYRLNKGDRQLDLTYEHSSSHQVPHHVSDVLSAITYYVYMARRTPKSVLCKHVRTIWVPAEYPSSIQRLQEWTPDECIPEFFTDASVFRSIHDDLDDLEVPNWCSGPEDFIEKHREALESQHVSERLHHWIDLTFGYKLSGAAALKSKNVCLHLANDHSNLMKSGIVQLFTQPHPPKANMSPFFAKTPPKIIFKPKKTRDRSNSSFTDTPNYSITQSDDDEPSCSTSSSRSPLALSKILSRSRSSLHEEPQGQKLSRSPSNQRSASVGPKNPSFTSHVSQKKSQPSLSTGTISLPKEYKPEQALELLEKKFMFISKTFHPEIARKFEVAEEGTGNVDIPPTQEVAVQNAFTNLIFSDNFEERIRNYAVKSHTFPPGDANNYYFKSNNSNQSNQIFCNYSDIISSRRTKELQILGCLIVEIFMQRQIRAMGANNINLSFSDRLKSALTVISADFESPPCIKYAVNLLLQQNLSNTNYPAVSDKGLPPPSAHLLLEPLLHIIIPFPKLFPQLYSLIYDLKEFENVSYELNILYYFDCNGDSCAEYENLERTKMLLAQNIGECKVKNCAKHLEKLLDNINPATDSEIVNILLPHVKTLIEDPPTSVLAAWYLFDFARVLGPVKSQEMLLDSILKLFENDLADNLQFNFNSKVAKLYHHSFLLRLMVRLGLKCFLENFVAPLVEAIGGYKDCKDSDNEFMFHNHSEKERVKKTSHLKNMDDNNMEMSTSSNSSMSSERDKDNKDKSNRGEEMFQFDEEKEKEKEENQMKSLIEHLELNVACDLPFNHSTAEEALDATLTENIEQLRNLEELNLSNLDADSSNVASPTIPIPSSYRRDEIMNISCEIGSKTDSLSDDKLNKSSPYEKSRRKESNVKISDMSSDSLIWLSHRLGPVLTARYLSRNLLKMLTLCYVGKDNLSTVSEDENPAQIAKSRVIGDDNAKKVLHCLASIAGLYGEQIILFQYIPHMSELIALCKRKLTPNLEGGLISCLALLKHLIPYMSDASIMDQLQDVILKNILHPCIRLLGTTKYSFPSGAVARNVIARKYLDTLYILSIRMGSDMTKSLLAVPALQRFFLIFSKILNDDSIVRVFTKDPEVSGTEVSGEMSEFVELKRDGTTTEWAIGGQPLQISHARLKDSESDSLSPPPAVESDDNQQQDTANQALEELKAVFNAELAYVAYLPFLKHIGESSLQLSLKNHDTIKQLCQEYEHFHAGSQSIKDVDKSPIITTSSSIGSNIAVVGNRLDVFGESQSNSDLLSLVSNRMENNSRHLRGNWLAYWEHEIGRSEKDTMFNFKQIKLQTFAGHASSVKCLYVLDNENSFMSGSRDKTVKLWSLRSQGDGNSVCNCQWTYAAHKKSILTITFVESMRLVASCDSIVHIWDPFMGANVGNLESAKFAPVNVLKSMPAPSSQIFAATTEGTIKVIDMRLCNYIHELKITTNPGLIRCLAVSPIGNWIAAGQSSGNITVLDTRTGLIIANWRAHEGEVLQLAALDNNTIISSSFDQMISVWNVADGKFKFHMRGATEPVHCLNIYNNELISGTTANRIGVHTSIDVDASFSSTKLRSDAFKGLLTSMATLPLNRLLLLGADTGNIHLLC